MRFVCKISDQLERAILAHLFLIKANKENKLNEVVNMDEVIECLDPIKVVEAFIVNVK